ncbi:MAG: class I SAM-dependent methyltransferase [Proteobacteria bacterium]|nr:class I SAM-dependent methyltransferase [Pseudomonadota bacterium]NBP13370.1 class I SAM-dependent methyltransferase [bacterium]
MSYVKQTVNTVADNYILQRLAIETCEGDVDSSQHVLTLFALACSLRAKSVLELGVRHGFTTLPLLAAMCITDGHLTSVDLDQPKVLHPEWELKDFMLGRWTFVQSDSLKFLSTAQPRYDLVYIDDWHGSEHVYKELKLISQYTDNRSLIVLHDLMHSSTHPEYNKKEYPQGNEFEGTGPYGGVEKFVNEAPGAYEYVTVPVCHGLTILRKK